MIIPTSREDWESLTAEQLDECSDLQLKNALKEYFGLKSHIYFMPVAKKREFILNPDARPTLQKEAEDRRTSHQADGVEHRGKKPVAELIDERSDGRKYTFDGVERYPDGFTDPFNDRKGKIAYVIMDVEDGAKFPIQKRTAKKLTELRRLKGFDDRISAKKQKPAHKAGHQTIEDVIAGGDPEVQEAVSALHQADPVTATTTAVENLVDPQVDAEPFDNGSEGELDDILNSIPQ
jgi:hypothetical protein